jgi:arabinose-5-phosphate isomerase
MPSSYLKKARQLIQIESQAIAELGNRINKHFQEAIELLFSVKGKVVVTGVGKSGLIGRKISATLSSTGTPSFFLNAFDAGHGDVGSLREGDALIVISNSGETKELLALLPYVKNLDLPLVGLMGKVNSTLAEKCDIVIDTGVSAEACPLGIVPTTSTIVAMAMGDALAIALMDKRKFKEIDFAGLHPAGSLGRRLLTTVRDLMHAGNKVPFANLNDTMDRVLCVITKKGLGVVGILDDKANMAGVITDGDLRRGLERGENFMQKPAKEVMTTDPKWISSNALAIDALYQMEQFAVTNLFVYDTKKNGKPVGIIHIHDILRYGIM